MRRAKSSQQLDLLDWKSPTPVKAFDPAIIRAASLQSRMAKAISVALKDANVPRREIAARMSKFLGEKVTENVINRYASESAEDHIINAVRFVALIAATHDRRLLEFIAEQFDWAVIERKYLPTIKLAGLHEQKEEINRHIAAARYEAKQSGAI